MIHTQPSEVPPHQPEGEEPRERRRLSRGRRIVVGAAGVVTAVAAPVVALGMSGGDKDEVTTGAGRDATDRSANVSTSITSTTLAPEAPVTVESTTTSTAPSTTTTVEAPAPLEVPRIEITADPTEVGAQVVSVANIYLNTADPAALQQFEPGTQATLDGLRARGITGLTPGLQEGDSPGRPHFIQGVGETPPGATHGAPTYVMNLGGYTAPTGEVFAGMQFAITTESLQPTILDLVIQEERFMPATTQIPGA